MRVVNATIKFVEATDRLDNNRWRQREEDAAESNRGEEGSEEGEESQSERERPLQGRKGNGSERVEKEGKAA